jgi:hypothetical protein
LAIRIEAVKEDDGESWIAEDEDDLRDMVDGLIDDLLKGEIDSFSVVSEEE